MTQDALREGLKQLLQELDASPGDGFLLASIGVLRSEILLRGGDPFEVEEA
jgi:hypothetical protein